MSDSEEDNFSNNSDDGDFSASEDDWVPPKKKGKGTSTTDESSDNSDFETTTKPEPVIGKNRKRVPKVSTSGSQQFAKKKPPGQNLREKLYNMYRPPPKTYSSPKQKRDLAEILEVAKFKTKKNLTHTEEPKKTESNSDDSDSSGDDYLVDPNKVDLNASFFDEKNTEREKTPPPNFDCNIGMRLSDSENSDNSSASDDESIKVPKTSSNDNDEKKSTNDLVANINKKSSDKMNFHKLQEFTKNLEHAKEHLKNFKSTASNDNNESKTIDVNQLLAMGEKKSSPKKKTPEKSSKKSSQSSSKSKSKRKIKELNNDSEESDWEEVEDENLSNLIPKDGVQITLNQPSTSNKNKSAKEIDLMACIKRQINRKKKENQVYLHKVNVLCWLAYGNSINKTINHPELMSQCIQLIPSKNCYPRDRTDKKYFQQITEWYKTCIALKDKTMYGKLKKLPNLLVSLALQIKTKAAICIRDYVLLFIILLRGMGIQTRMVINFVTIPIRPATSELCTINVKEKDDDKKKINKVENTNKIEIPQLDGDNEIITDKLKQKTTEYVPSPRKTRSKSREEETKKSSSRRRKSDKEKISKISPRVTRSKSRERSDNSKSSKKVSTSKEQDTRKKLSNKKIGINSSSDKNKIVQPSPRKTRSQSREDVNHPSGFTLIKRKSSNKIENIIPIKKPQLSKLIKSSTMKPITPTKRLHKSDDDDDDFVVKKTKKVSPIISNGAKKSKQLTRVQKIDRRVLSTDDESKPINNEDDKANKKRICVDIWIEVYSETEECWLTIDLIKGKVHKPEELARNATHPLTYVIAWNNDNSIKDVSARYCQQWNTVTRKLRCAKEWLNETFTPYLSKIKTIRDKNEDMELNKIHLDKPLPTTISEFKDHPLYALERHLLKFQAIYPTTALTLGYIRNEPIYARECVHTLHSREIWVKQARVVKPGEKPYKIVMARPKWDKYTNTVIKNIPLEIFGFWQTKEYEPPTAENGIVPRNAYGNVELFKECMLPKKTVHLQLAGLNKVCKKMRVDCAPAVVGFDFHQGYSHPTFDGFVVCEEFAEKVIEAWIKDQEEQEQREEEKYEKRVYGNWKRLIRGLRIRERLNTKYNFNNSKEKELNIDFEHQEYIQEIDKQLQLVLFNRKKKLENDKAAAKATRKSSTNSKIAKNIPDKINSISNTEADNQNKRETLKEKLAKRKESKVETGPVSATKEFIDEEQLPRKETLKEKLAKRKTANVELVPERLHAIEASAVDKQVVKKETLKEKIAKRKTMQETPVSEDILSTENKVGTRSSSRIRNKK